MNRILFFDFVLYLILVIVFHISWEAGAALSVIHLAITIRNGGKKGAGNGLIKRSVEND